MKRLFTQFANKTAALAGHYVTFIVALGVIVVWGITGPLFHFSDTWQLVINTGTTIVTFLMVFLIQNTQNRDAQAVHIKLDELIRSINEADNAIIRAEDDTDDELADLKRKYEALCDQHDDLLSRLGIDAAGDQPPADRAEATAASANGRSRD